MGALSDLIGPLHAILERSILPGSVVLDATMGNGHDTLFLAGLVGKAGLVFAMDKQIRALESTRALLTSQGFGNSGSIRLLHADHADMAAVLESCLHSDGGPKRLDLCMFNLGFLPGGDKSVTTVTESTIAAMTAVWKELSPGGTLSVHAYSGHQGGAIESQAVHSWMTGLPRDNSWVVSMTQANKPHNRESVYIATKKR